MQKVMVEKWTKVHTKTKGFHSMKIPDGNAEFMAWGIDSKERSCSVGPYSTAIIKRHDGSIENVDCELIKFVS